MSKKRRTEPSGKTRKRRDEIIRKQRRMLVGGIAVVVAAVALIVCVVLGVFEQRAEVSMVTLEDDGTVTGEEIETLGEDYYSKNELKAFVKDAIDAYNEQAGEKAVRLKKLSVKGEEAYLRTTYKSAEDYQAFNGFLFFAGSLKAAGEAGYDFSDVFVSVQDGKKGDAVSPEDIMKDTSVKVIVLRQNVTVQVPGKILFVSERDTKIQSDDTVTISPADGNPDATGLTYIIYK